MTVELRRRIVALEGALAIVLAILAVAVFVGASFSHRQISDELSAQQIVFPAANNPQVTSLPADARAAMDQYAGQQLTTGDQAQVWANDFMRPHISQVAGGQTYAQVSAQSFADPSNTKLAGQASALFQGTALRAALLNSYAWWTVGTIAFGAAWGLAIMTVAVVAALVFEIRRWRVAGDPMVLRAAEPTVPVVGRARRNGGGRGDRADDGVGEGTARS